jgi:hypothetical protein
MTAHKKKKKAQGTFYDVNKQEVGRYINEFQECLTQIRTTGKLNTIKRKQISLEAEIVVCCLMNRVASKGQCI